MTADLGYCPRATNPKLHRYARTVRGIGPTRTVWLCGGEALHPEFCDEPNGMRPCVRCWRLAQPDHDRVYFAERDGLIKIGQSNHPAVRAGQLGARLLLSIPGDGRTEAALHLAFAHLRVAGEWFTPAPELRRLIEFAAQGVKAAS